MNNSLPLVSIITVVYNGEKYIEQTIKSVVNQTYNNIEYIVVDGGSTDNTLNILRTYEKYISVLITEPDHGIYDAMNKGINLAKGEIIGIINSDDWYEDYTVEKIVEKYMCDNSSIFYGLMRHYLDEKPIEIFAIYPNYIPQKMIPHPTCFIPKKIYEQYGMFNLKYKSCADYHLILNLFNNNVKFCFIEEILANFRFGGYSWKLSSLVESFNMRYEMGFISRKRKMVSIIGLYFMSILKFKN